MKPRGSSSKSSMRTRGAFAGCGFVIFHRRRTLPFSEAIDRCGAYFGGLSGWRRYICAFLGGGLATLASAADRFSAGAFSVDIGLRFAIGPAAADVARILLPSGGASDSVISLSASIGLATRCWSSATSMPGCCRSLPWVCRRSWRSTRAPRLASRRCARGRLGNVALAVAAAFAAVDWLRGHVLTGLPWNLFGHAWSGLDPLLQSASLYGIYGMGLLALVAAALPAAAIGRRYVHEGRLSILVAAGAIVVVHWGGGVLRLAAEPPCGDARRRHPFGAGEYSAAREMGAAICAPATSARIIGSACKTARIGSPT